MKLKSSFLIIVVLFLTMPLYSQDSGVFEGVVLNKKNNEPVSYANVRIEPGNITLDTDNNGRFRFEGLAFSTYTVKAFIYGYDMASFEIDLKKDKMINRTIYLNHSKEIYLDEIVVREKKRKIEGTKQVLRKKHIKNTSTSIFNDTMASLSRMPGVVGNEFSGLLYIRGGTPLENIAIMDDVPILFPYVWGGTVSMFNPEMVEKVEFYTGGFPAIYGMATSGVIDVAIKQGNNEKIKGYFDLSAAEATLSLDGPIRLTKESSFILGARRTHYDLIAPLFMDREGVIFPYFSDTHLKFYTKLNDKHSLSYNIFYSFEGMKWTLNSEEAADDSRVEEGDSFRYENKNLINSLQWKYIINDKIKTRNTLAYHFTEGFADLDYAKIPIKQKNKMYFTQFRSDWDLSLNQQNSLSLGYSGFYFTGDIHSEGYIERTLYTGDISQDSVDFDYDGNDNYNAFYIQNEYEPVKDDFTLSYGMRYATTGLSPYDVFSPRAGLRKKICEDTYINMSWGIFYRYEIEIQKYDKEHGNPDLKPENSTHYILGIERNITKEIRLKSDIFYKDYKDIVTRDPVDNYVNGVVGYAYGFETMLEKKESEKWDGWVSYTWAMTKRKINKPIGYYDPSNIDYYDPYNRDRITVGEWFYPDYDQRHTLSAILNYIINEKWSVYGSWEFHTGRPYTEILGPYPVPGLSDTYLPIKDKYNDERLPYYLRVDIKGTYKHKFFGLEAESYIEVMNASARDNVSGYYWTDNYTNKKASLNFPLIIIGGIKVKF
ncbi:MAG: TonB-dependent receptor [Endomicrobiales bacterium]|nr:TonB-dependent receptor [Endomicrobiales bacterium]